jgi:hypothetical protein
MKGDEGREGLKGLRLTTYGLLHISFRRGIITLSYISECTIGSIYMPKLI